MHISIIFNPTAGSSRRRTQVRLLQAYLRLYGNKLELLATRGPGDATRLAANAVKNGTELVLAVGGDGTINEVIQGMVGCHVPLAVYPAGTTNVWCKQIKMPSNPRQAALVIQTGPRRAVDLGQADARYFLLMAGIGIDAEVTQAVNLELKRKLGKFAYLVEVLRLGFLFQGTTAHIVLEPGSATEHTLLTPASLVIVTNAERYAIVKLAPEAQVDDGKLELLIFQARHPWERLTEVLAVLLNLPHQFSKVKRFRVSRAKIETDPPVAVQLDGDPSGSVGSPAMDIRCIPAALQMVVPANAPDHLFSYYHD
jgi:YegS/Rv2252/BmrU family lipid kinase